MNQNEIREKYLDMLSAKYNGVGDLVFSDFDDILNLTEGYVNAVIDVKSALGIKDRIDVESFYRDARKFFVSKQKQY